MKLNTHLLSSMMWRLNNLYAILDVKGRLVKFKLNGPQKKLLANFHKRLLVPKARQNGISTLLAVMLLDHLLHRKENTKIPIIDKTIDDAKDKLSKVKIAWDNLDNQELHPDTWEYGCLIKANWTMDATANKLEFTGPGGIVSQVTAQTSGRGGTAQFMFSSELGHVDKVAPQKAKDIVTGALPSVHKGSIAILESTLHCGRNGEYWGLLEKAIDLQNRGVKDVSDTEYKYIFLGWQDNETYVDYDTNYQIPHEHQELFAEYAREGITLTHAQCVFYSKKRNELSSWELMYQEYPTTLTEALSVGSSDSIYGYNVEEMRKDKRIIQNLRPRGGYTINAFWDVGRADGTVVHLIEYIPGKEINILASYEGRGKGPADVASFIRGWEQTNKQQVYMNYLPHDCGHAERGSGKTYEDYLIELGLVTMVCIRPKSVWDGINWMRLNFKQVWVDAKLGVKQKHGNDSYSILDSFSGYTKGTNGSPKHDNCSHACDALRVFAELASTGEVITDVQGMGGQTSSRTTNSWRR